ncbi:ABC transporter permease subunit [uncultured Brevibacillus sp.]|uniref:ABC transporter permease n=1 Tax=uncultured Brevibacillus sp. TaxID=169970 RepID=UPI0025946784|nr:ABC transporter permease subunit [uncultured Brevibacillus sp.]
MSLLPFAFLVLCFELLPLLVMVLESFRGDGGVGWGLEQYTKALTSKYYLQGLSNSFFISLCASAVGIVVALFAAYSITRFSQRMRDFLLMLSNMTSNFSGVPLAFAYIIILGSNGLFTLLFKQLGWTTLASIDLFSWFGLVCVYVYFQIPLAILLLYPTYYGIHQQWRESAALLGASTVQFWRYIGLPVILPGVVGTFSILFANAMGAYATAYALVGGNYNLIAIRIGSLVAGDVAARPELAGALAVILAITMVTAMLINEWMMRRVRRELG